MALTKYTIGKYLELHSEKCGIPDLTEWDISGINSDKEFFEPSKQVGADTSNYKIVPPGFFACNLMHVGRDCVLPIALNHSLKSKIVSPAYTIFKIKDNAPFLTDYFFLLLKSKERDRYFWFHTDSSVRDGMSWDDFGNLEIELPSKTIQQKYVDVYNLMNLNQKNYECGLEDLKKVCDLYIENLRRNLPSEPIGKYTRVIDDKNVDGKIKNVKGLTVYKKFIDTKADMTGVSLNNYKIVRENDIAYVPTTNRNGDRIACGLCKEECIVSTIYEVIRTDSEYLLPEYLFMWFKRSEFDRWVRYNSWGSARETIEWEDIKNYQIPIPDIKIQKSILSIFHSFQSRYDINEKIKNQIKGICPILIKGSIDEAKKEA